MRQVLILRSDGAVDPANFTVPLYDSLSVLTDSGAFEMRLEEVLMQPTNGNALPTTPVEVRVNLGLPMGIWDSRSRGASTTIGFLQNFDGGYQHPWVVCSSGQPFNQIGVSLRTLDGGTVPNLICAIVSLSLKSIDQ